MISPGLSSVTYCDIEGGYPGEGNIEVDPLFVHPGNIYTDPLNEPTQLGNFQFSVHSPCIDAGTPAGAPIKDIDGNPRPQGVGYDMGAYEVR